MKPLDSRWNTPWVLPVAIRSYTLGSDKGTRHLFGVGLLGPNTVVGETVESVFQCIGAHRDAELHLGRGIWFAGVVNIRKQAWQLGVCKLSVDLVKGRTDVRPGAYSREESLIHLLKNTISVAQEGDTRRDNSKKLFQKGSLELTRYSLRS